jgi:hypothetical protein
LVRGLGLSISVFLAGLSLASLVSAQPVTTTTSAIGTAKHAVLQSLRQAHKLLVNADHDYDGHRARAAEEVHKAIRELEGKHRVNKAQTGMAPVVTTKPAKVRQPAMHESQANSDAQLRQALTILQGVQTELNSHHPKAFANVTAAIGQINTALRLK